MVYQNLFDTIGNTPLLKLKSNDLAEVNLYLKLEFYNPTGSAKDRAAAYIINKLLHLKEINQETILIESSSGNFGISLSAYCKAKGLQFCCIIDPNISATNEALIRNLGARVFKVMEPDPNGGYLLNRIAKVKELVTAIPNSYWVNQYGNPYNAEAYYQTLGEELCNELDPIDYVFIGVSSGGTITGVSQKIKTRFPQAKIIAVDIEGSVIFGGAPKKRYIPGIGSSMVPSIIRFAKIDEVVTIDEKSTVEMCNELVQKYSIFAGGSSGSVFAAVKKYFRGQKTQTKPNVIAIFPDRGDRYINTVYNEKWCNEVLFQS
ncbi:MAG TPA: 2,3-diaminopropionate biosynthesis protein SbnA [Bacillota bacterium]|nr:2,3-diaminopropionate biosynthesis protein SbnA [Bacillota bacterium]